MYVSAGFEGWILELVVVATSFFNLFKYQIKMGRAPKEQSQKSTDRFTTKLGAEGSPGWWWEQIINKTSKTASA